MIFKCRKFSNFDERIFIFVSKWDENFLTNGIAFVVLKKITHHNFLLLKVTY